MKVAAYIRVSTEGQTGEDRYGLAEQQEAIKNYAKAKGHKIVAWFSDEGISGATINRDGLQDMLNAAEQGKFNAVIVAKMDRIARDLMAQLWIEKELLKAEVEIISVAEPFQGQDPANVLFRQMIGAFAQFEKARITERMTGGRRQKAKEGGYAGGAAPIGYKAHLGGKTLEIDKEKVETVLRAFEIRKHNPKASLQEIADILNREGHRTKRGKPFLPMTVKRILDRKEFYKGQYQYTDIKAAGQHEALL